MAKFEASGIKELDFMTVGICLKTLLEKSKTLLSSNFLHGYPLHFPNIQTVDVQTCSLMPRASNLAISFYFHYILSIFGIL